MRDELYTQVLYLCVLNADEASEAEAEAGAGQDVGTGIGPGTGYGQGEGQDVAYSYWLLVGAPLL